MRTEYIYVLHGDNGIPFYCGHTTWPEKRLERHLEESIEGGRSFKCGHIRALLSQGQTVRMRVVDECPADELGDLERYWISQLGYKVFLYNSNGGTRAKREKAPVAVNKPEECIEDC